jgi:SAM-dependent methyltransferase
MTDVVGMPELTADVDVLRFRAPADALVDVFIDGNRVWTVRVESELTDRDGGVEVAWPAALAERLRGSAVVEARESPSGAVLGSAQVRFDDFSGGPDLYDGQGAPLSLTKYGRLRASFDALADSTLDAYLDQAELVVRALRDDCEREAFLDYGTLLGAVRDQSLIGHDLDLDIGYVSRADNPTDAMRESFWVERVLRSVHGWRIVRKDGGLMQVFFPQPDGRRRNIDIFTCFVMDGRIYQVHDTEAPGSRDDLVPTSTVTLEGRAMPAPRRPEMLLESLYGPSWRIPDPSFQYDSTAAQRKLTSWFVGPRHERDQWAQFYARRGDDVPDEPTPFAPWVAEQSTASRIVDVGCGNGRDSVFFAAQGRSVVGLDAVPGALIRARRLAKAQGLAATFTRLNLNSLRETLAHGGLEARGRPGDVDVYARFLLHCLAPVSRENFWRYTAMVLSGGGRCFVEFRTRQDRGLPKHFAQRRHTFLATRAAAEGAERFGGQVVYEESGTGRARFGEEDPHVCRMVVQW